MLQALQPRLACDTNRVTNRVCVCACVTVGSAWESVATCHCGTNTYGVVLHCGDRCCDGGRIVRPRRDALKKVEAQGKVKLKRFFAPVMSSFISRPPSPLRFSPPVSNTMPFPTSPIGGAVHISEESPHRRRRCTEGGAQDSSKDSAATELMDGSS